MARTQSHIYFLQIVNIFVKKPFHEKWLLINMMILSFFIRLMVLFLPFKYLAKLLGKQGEQSSIEMVNINWEIVNNYSKKINHISRVVPWNSNCLVQVALGKILLKREKIISHVHFGVKKYENELKAHAWLSVGKKIVLGGELAGEYKKVSTFT